MNPTELDDDFRPGPRHLPRPVEPPGNGATPVAPLDARSGFPEPAADEGDGLRAGDTGEGRVKQVAHDQRPLGRAELELLRRAEQADVARQLFEVDELLAEETPFFKLPRLIASPLLGSVLLGTAALLGLFLFNQAMAAAGIIANLAQPWQSVAWAGLGVLGGGALFAFGRVAYWYFRLRRNVPVRFQVLQELDRRRDLRRWVVESKWREAWQRMDEYLLAYPLEPGLPARRLAALGFKPKVIEELRLVRDQLRDRNRFMGEDLALQRFRETFQAKLDEVAEKRVQYWALRSGVVTALSPNTLADTLATLYFTFSMLGDLCTIYNLRTGRSGTAVLLSRVFFNTYLAGEFNELEGMAGDQLTNMFHDFGMSSLLSQVLGKLTTKLGAGVANSFLLRRLGAHACQMLRPVSRV